MPTQHVEEWSLFTGCTPNQACTITTTNSCGEEEGYYLRLLCDWNPSLCMPLFKSLIIRLYLQTSMTSPVDACPHSFFFIVDMLMHRQRIDLPTADEDQPNLANDNNHNHNHANEKEENEKQEEEIPIQPAHHLIFQLLSPMFQIVQTTSQACESSIPYLYRLPNDKNRHYFGDTPRVSHSHSLPQSDVTLWQLFEISQLLLLLDFFNVDTSLQKSLSTHIQQSEKQIRAQLRWSDGRGLGDRGVNGVERRIGYGTVLPFAVGMVGVGGIGVDVYLEHLMDEKIVGENEDDGQ